MRMKNEDKKYTIKEFKEMFDKAVNETLKNPEVKNADKKDGNHLNPEAKFSCMLAGMILFHTLEENLFGEE